MQIPACIHDFGRNFRGSNRLPEATGSRPETADLVHPLPFAEEDTGVGRGWAGADKGRDVRRPSLPSHGQTRAAQEPEKMISAPGILCCLHK